ncbi:fibronectin type III domain-containing protein [Actinoplanes sp. NBRC 103695]|uniref:beta strand repeat-containing protein n=1 Tax=Actinoplanes sp. NBRC 103695 TaxID=3032202 RepID=UPI002554BF12|nr:fibronectin type III domain-containing protein [Actinoplanes sp. NBRC 103695]
MSLASAAPAWATTSPCTDGSAPAPRSTVSCTEAGNYSLAVPVGTTTVDLDVIGGGGGAGYPARQHIGGHAAEVTGTASLPNGTAYLYVIVGTAGSGDNHGTSSGGKGSAVFALDGSHELLAKLAIAGGGGGGAYNGDGGNAGSPGNSDNAQTVSGPGGAGTGATGGAGGTGNYAPGTAGGSDNPTALTVAVGGNGGAVPGGATGGGGAGGYGGGGGGGGSRGSILSSNVAGGGGGSSLASNYLDSASISVKPGTGGVQLPGLVASDGAVGSVVLTFNGVAVPGAPTGVSAAADDQQASVSFSAPASDGGSSITSYTVTSSPGGHTATCPGSPCVVTGLTNGTAYTFTVHATNANGDSTESSASTPVTPATPPGAPTDTSAVAGAGQASVWFNAPASDGGSSITSYTVTSSPGGHTATCPGSPCVVTGLTNGTAYTFTVHATNAIDDSPESAPTAAVTPLGAPAAPTGVSAAPGDTVATVSFTASADNGGTAVTGYTVTSSPGGLTGACAASPCTVTGLTNGTAYTFTVHATNAVGPSAESIASSAVTPASVPGAPTHVAAVAGAGQADVSFDAPAGDGGSAITGYTATSSPGGLTGTCASSPCTVSGLTNGTAYTFTVRATNAIGDSPASAASTAVTPADVPNAPVVSATPGDEQITVAFTAPADQGSPITGYLVSTNGGSTWSTLPTTTSGGTVTGTVTGLTNGTTYAVRVRAVNGKGDGVASITRSVTPATVPGAPTGVSATRGNASASVSFTAPSSDGGTAITSYTVSSAPGGLSATCASSPCTVTGLANGTAYTFTVRATNPVGSSAASAASSPVTPATVAAAPASVTVTGGDSSASLSFTAPGNTGGEAITGYEYSTDGSTWHSLTVSGTAPVTATITGLTNGISYPVRVRALNAVGPGTASAAEAVTPATTPGTPFALTAVRGAGQAEVSFQPPSSDGGATITSYTVTSAPGGITADCAESPCTVTGLTNGTAYTFTVHATNSAGDSGESNATDPIIPSTTPGVPDAVTTAATATSITVSFIAPATGGSPITGYEISTDGGVNWVAFSPSGSPLTGTVTGLTPGTDYQVAVRALNTVGSGDPTTAEAVTTLPAKVAGPTATVGTSSATVTWTQSPTSTVTGYTVYAHPGPATCTTEAITATSCVIGAIAGVSYTYTVVAHSPSGDSAESVASEPITATSPTVPAEAPTSAPTTLTTTEGQLSQVDPGQRITVVGTGFAPYSSVSIIFYSESVVLGTAVTDADGDFTKEITVPSSLTPGSHNLVAAGVDSSGAVHMIRMLVTVEAASPGAGGQLPVTGAPVLALAIWSGLITAIGVGLVVYAGRRPAGSRSGFQP